jgi:hypothetical protein
MPRASSRGGAPSSIAEYVQWLQSAHGVTVDDELRTTFARAVERLFQDFGTSDFWLTLHKRVLTANNAYYVRTGHEFLRSSAAPALLTKSFDSFLAKTFRKNVLRNSAFPRPPEGDWLLPPEWITRVSDLVRTTYVLTYVDAVEPVTSAIADHALASGHERTTSMEATIAGYYAGHVDVTAPITFGDVLAVMSVEIQVTTELQDVLRHLLHRNYEVARLRPISNAWMWQQASVEFRTNYLGHMLHYVEGAIVNERDGHRAD